ncbi:MAG: YqgE/AlgH family protein [Flavobacterium sp.]
MHKTILEKGMLLVAEPSIIGDMSFHRSVILLAEHSTTCSVGFILNKPLAYTLNDLIPEINAFHTIYNGGPVEQDNLYFMHTIPELIPESIEISNGIYWGGDFEITKDLLQRSMIPKERIRFFLGYSGWDANQLEEELEADTWLVCENNYRESIFETVTSSFWKKKMKELGGAYLLWSNAPSDPNLN